ncbi:hypothetical protein CYY_009579 [Polysphondylium violaceum]|uniref:NB-ARC domain-containing protein n=1 Tax=Polysphondylium violaceum TaxID=133409 RepID=A0A8J4PJW4_9MYCE|nr:hypothetical protein CYY_009579 [Polysphondylium violaceum]
MNQHCVCILHSCFQEVFSTISIFEKHGAIKFGDVKQSSDFVYKEGVLEINNSNAENTISHTIRVILSFPSNQTVGDTSINTSRVLDTFKPSLAILVGTCSGYKYNEPQISKGDIIVATSAFDYQTSINTNDGPEFSMNLIESTKLSLDALKLTDHSKSDWAQYPSIEPSTTYKREWLFRAFFEYRVNKDNLKDSVWLEAEGFDIDKSIPRNNIIQKMFGNQYYKEKEILEEDNLLEEDENSYPKISDQGMEKMNALIDIYGNYPRNIFTDFKPKTHFGQFGCGLAIEKKYEYEVVNKKRKISLGFKQCREKAIDMIAIDRDTHAFYFAAKNYKDISFISVKSVLDFADGDTDQNNNYIDYCNQLSSSFALQLIRSHSFQSNEVQLIFNFIPPPPGKSINRLGSDNKGYIQKISDSFKSNSVTISSRISGMGGVGKSTLAKQFALHCIDNQFYKYIFWIHGETQETLLESYKQVLQHLKEEIKNHDNIVTAFALTIQQFKGKVLLIYDNVEDMSLIKEKPQGNHINILITTRSQVCDDDSSTLITLDLLNSNECKSLFKLWRPNISDTHIAELSRLLQRLPLAISHCLAYMDRVRIEEEEYIKEFEMFNETQVIGKGTFTNPYERLIGKTISMAIGKMKNQQDLESRATTLLHIMAFLNPDQIHSKVLEIILKGKDKCINAVVKILKDFSLISTDEEPNTNQNYNISIHRVVQRLIIVLLLQKLKNNNSTINLIYDNLSHINNQISTYFYSNITNINIRNSNINSNSILIDNYSILNNMSIHLTNIQTIIQKMDNLPHKQNLELTNKLLLTQIIMECNHLRYLILNSTVNRQVLEALFLESNIDKNNISELADITIQFINQNQLTEEKDIKVALNIFSKFMSGEGISKDRCNIILMFIFLSLGKIGHFLDKDIQFFKQISTKRISIINDLLSHLPGKILTFSQLQNMFTINLMASNSDYSNLIDNLVHLNDKVKGLSRSSTKIIFNSFQSFGSIDPTIIHFTTILSNEDTNDNHFSKIFDILIKFKNIFSNDQIKIVINYIEELLNNVTLDDYFKKLLEVMIKIIDFEKLENIQIQNLFNFTKSLIKVKFNGHHTSKILSELPNQITKYQLHKYQIKNIINLTKQLINENMDDDHILSIISNLLDQIANCNGQPIINYIKQLFNENMNDMSPIIPVISTLSKKIIEYQLNNDQIQNIIDYTKQLIMNQNMNSDHISSIVSIISKLITKYQLNNDQIQTIINYIKQLINENMDGYEISEIISTLSKEITFNHLDQIKNIINYTKQLMNGNMNGSGISSIISIILKQKTEYQLNNDQIQTIVNYTKQLINERMNGYHISSIVSTLSEKITKYQLNNDQIQNIFNYTKQLIYEINGYHISEIISTLSKQISQYKLNHDQIQNIIDYTKQLIITDGIMNSDGISSIVSIISKLITKYQLNNDQIQTIINYTKQLINENLDHYNISEIISIISEQITKYQLNNDQIQNFINSTNEFINENMNTDDISSIISTIAEQITIYQFNTDHIQNIINYTKQLINENLDHYHISEIISIISEQITKYQLNNDQIQNIINSTNEFINEKMNVNHTSKILSTLSKQIFKYQLNNNQFQTIIYYTKQFINENKAYYDISEIISTLSEQISQDPSNFKECFKNNIVLNTYYHIGFKYSNILHLYSNNPLAFEQSYICILPLNQSIASNQFLNFLEIMIACNSEERNYIMAKFISEYRDEINAETINLAKDKIMSLKEKDMCCLKNHQNSLDENDTDTRVLFTKLNDVKEHIQDYDFKILCRQLSFHPKLFKESIIKSFIKIKNSLGLDRERHGFRYLIFQSLYPYDDDQLELVCNIIEKTREYKQEYFCCNLHIANNIQRLYYYNYKFTIGGVNFLKVFYSQLKDIDSKSNLECMKTVLFNTLNPKIRFNANT